MFWTHVAVFRAHFAVFRTHFVVFRIDSSRTVVKFQARNIPKILNKGYHVGFEVAMFVENSKCRTSIVQRNQTIPKHPPWNSPGAGATQK